MDLNRLTENKSQRDLHSDDSMATGLLRLCALSSMVRGSLLLLGWILEQTQSSAWQELSLGDTHTHAHKLASTHTHAHVHTHAHTIQTGNQTSAPGEKKKMLIWFPSNRWCVLDPHEKWKIKMLSMCVGRKEKSRR